MAMFRSCFVGQFAVLTLLVATVEGQARRSRDRGGEKGDARRRPPRKPPKGWKGPWPPKELQPWN